jgi:hypothetical protein
MNSGRDFWLFVLCVFFIVTVFFEAVSLANASSTPADFKPGDPIVVLQNKTVIQENGQPCQLNTPAFISPNGPEGEQNWHKIPRPIFPMYTLISVIFTDGAVSWQPVYNIIKTPADPNLLLCP